MNALSLILVASLAASVTLQAQVTADDLDVLHLQDGTVLHGRVQRLASKSIAMLVQVPAGGGTVQHEIPTSNLKFIDFAPMPGEVKALANPHTPANRKRLLELWQEKSVNLRWPSNNAGAIGLAYAGALMAMKDSDFFERALVVYSLIEKEDWDIKRRNTARRERLRGLIKLKRIAEAIVEAGELAKTSDDTEVLLEARMVLAEAEFERLKSFQDTHPRWMDDDDLAAERMRLYHQTLDLFLRIALFHGAPEHHAASALWAVVSVHQFAGEPEPAAQRARDLVELYPQATEAGAAAGAAARQPLPATTPNGSVTSPSSLKP